MISPHGCSFVFSCGGFNWENSRILMVLWAVFTGSAPSARFEKLPPLRPCITLNPSAQRQSEPHPPFKPYSARSATWFQSRDAYTRPPHSQTLATTPRYSRHWLGFSLHLPTAGAAARRRSWGEGRGWGDGYCAASLRRLSGPVKRASLEGQGHAAELAQHRLVGWVGCWVDTRAGRRHGFLSGGGGSNRRQGGQPTPKYPKNRKNAGFWPLHSRISGGRPARFSKVRRSGPPPPPTATPVVDTGRARYEWCPAPFSWGDECSIHNGYIPSRLRMRTALAHPMAWLLRFHCRDVL